MRKASFDELRAIQESTIAPRIDLSHLCEACMRIALGYGPEAIVNEGAAILALQVDEAFSTQACSECGSLGGPKGLEGLRIRRWTCVGCGAEHDRDVTAARNIARVGLDALAEGASA